MIISPTSFVGQNKFCVLILNLKRKIFLQSKLKYSQMTSDKLLSNKLLNQALWMRLSVISCNQILTIILSSTCRIDDSKRDGMFKNILLAM